VATSSPLVCDELCVRVPVGETKRIPRDEARLQHRTFLASRAGRDGREKDDSRAGGRLLAGVDGWRGDVGPQAVQIVAGPHGRA
jgi:hypothetical protein